MKENKPVSVATDLKVPLQKSSRLEAILKQSKHSTNTIDLHTVKTQQSFVSDLKPEIKVALLQAVQQIEIRLANILNDYPAGKKSSFFKLKYGVDEMHIKELAIKDAFALLALDATKIQYFKEIEILNSNGEKQNRPK